MLELLTLPKFSYGVNAFGNGGSVAYGGGGNVGVKFNQFPKLSPVIYDNSRSIRDINTIQFQSNVYPVKGQFYQKKVSFKTFQQVKSVPNYQQVRSVPNNYQQFRSVPNIFSKVRSVPCNFAILFKPKIKN